MASTDVSTDLSTGVSTSVSLGTSVGPSRRPGFLARWWRRRRLQRAQLAHAVWDLRERYGPAAHRIALSSAHRVAGFERRFWIKVAARLRGRE